MLLRPVFSNRRGDRRQGRGGKYLKLPGSKEGNALPPVAVLVDKSGSVENGKAYSPTRAAIVTRSMVRV